MKKLLLALVMLGLSMPAYAAPAVTQEGAAALKKLSEAALAKQESSLKSAGLTLIKQGDVVVEEAGTYYAVTSPNLSLKMPDGVTRNIGMIAINAIPTDDPKIYKMAVALPTPIVDTDAAGNTVGTLTIGSQTMNGSFNFDAQNFTSVTGDYKNIVSTRNNGEHLTIGSLGIRMDLTDQGQGLWSGPTNIAVADMTYKNALGGEYNVKQSDLSAKLDRADLLSVNLFKIKLQQAMSGAPGPQRDDKIKQMLRSFLGTFADGLDLMSASSGITFKSVLDGKTSAGTIASSNITLGLKDIKSNKGTFTINSATQGLKFEDPNSAQFAPSQITLQAAGSGLSLQKLLNMPATDKINLKEILSQPGSKLTVQKMDVAAQAFGMNATADLTSAPQTPLGASGNIHLNVRGVEALSGWLMDPNGAAASGVQVPPALIPTLAIMQLSGQASGDGMRTYDVVLDSKGGITMNGTPIAAPKQ
ncbi:MAG TPA: hypothetical protein VIN59_05350 [Alphaproteobacteria bacterium]